MFINKHSFSDVSVAISINFNLIYYALKGFLEVREP